MEERVKLKALYEAGEAWRQQGFVDKALPFYEKAGAKGDVSSLLRLGEIYSSEGVGRRPDAGKAVQYFSSAARKGDRTALYRLGVIYQNGDGVEVNASKAKAYFRQAIGPGSRGDAGAMFASAAALLDAGERVNRADVVRVLRLLLQNSAAGRASDRSVVLLAAAELNRDAGKDLPADFVLPEPEQLRQQAVVELQRAVDGADGASKPDLPRLQYRLASLLENSAGGAGNDGRAAALFEAAASAGYLPARFRVERPSARGILGHGNSAGAEAQADDAAAADVAPSSPSSMAGPAALIEAAAEAGDAEAQVELGQLFLLGVGRDKNAARSFEWFRRASRGGSPDGQYQLGLSYKHGRGTGVNSYNAAEAFRLAAGQGHPDAMYEYGSALAAGRGVEKDTVAADQWLKRASDAGSGAAAFALAKEALRSKPDGTRDLAGARTFFLQGARAGDPQSQMEFLKLVFAGSDARELEMSGSTGQELFSWSTMLADDRSLSESQRKLATYFLGQCYARAIGTSKDLTRAAELFAGSTGLAVESGDSSGASSP